jgi:predicted nuclease of predicted toxin-antitoxin system
MRILADMPISPRTVEFLNGLGHEAVHALDLGMAHAPDEEIIQRAKAEGMSILTEDLDYAAILAVSGEIEPGVIILRVGNWTRDQIDRRLERILEELPEERFRNAIVIVERHRVRIRRLPVRPE